MKKILLSAVALSMIACAGKTGLKSRLYSYEGVVKINGTAVSEQNRVINYGDLIETGDKSFCTIMIEDKNILKIGAGSRLVYKLSRTDNILALEQGWMAGVTRKVFTSKGKFTIHSPTVAAGIRGTSFCTRVENPGSTYFCVCNGEIELIKAGDASGDRVASAHHAARRYVKKDGKIIIEKNPGLLYHNDDGIVELAKLINETIDWSKPDPR